MEYSLFGYSGQDLRESFPEIAETEEFKKLKMEELTFAWYYGNRTSPFYPIKDPRKKVIRCLPILKDVIGEDEIEKYLDLRFPPHLQAAINKMEEFDPPLRSVAKTMTGQIVDNLRKVVSEDVNEYTEASDKKAFIDTLISIGKNLPDLVKSLERGYGITKTPVKQIEEKSWDSL